MSRLSKAMLVVGAFSLCLAMSSLAGATGNSQSRSEGKRVDTRIVFESNHLCDGNDCGNGEIAVMNLTGSGFKRLTHNTVSEGSPAWSPKKQRIAFYRDLNIWVMDANGRHQRRLTNQALANEPDWSPDGRRIVFSGGTDQPGYSGLRTVNIKTGRLTRAAVGSVLDSCSGLVAGRNADRLR